MLLFTRKMILFILYPAISIVALHAQKNISIQKADLLYKQGNYQGALIEYENAISYDAKNYELWLKKGDIYASLKDWSNTSKSLERVVELKKDYREGYQRLFKIYTKNGEIDKAISTLEKAYENDTDTDRKSSYKVQIITILGDNNQLEEVQKHIQDLKNLGVNHPISLYYASKYHNQMQSYQKAIQSAEAGLSMLSSQSAKATQRYYYEIGYAYYHLKDYQNARINLSRANYGSYKPMIFKMTCAYNYRIASAYFKIQDYEKSTVFLDLALEINPNYKYAKSLQRKISKLQTIQDKSIDSLKKLMQTQKHPIAKSQTMIKLANLHYKGENYEEALKIVNDALKLAENLDAEFLRAITYYQTKNYEKSVQTISQLLQIKHFKSPAEKAPYFFIMGLAHEKAKNEKAALEQYEKAKKYGNFKYAVMERMEQLREKV